MPTYKVQAVCRTYYECTFDAPRPAIRHRDGEQVNEKESEDT